MTDTRGIVGRLADIDAIARLKADYAHLVDAGWSGGGEEPLGDLRLFTSDAVWRSSVTGEIRGLAAIRTWRESVRDAAPGLVGYHLLANPNIDVEGDQASGRWHAVIVSKAAPGPEARVVFGIYLDRFRRTAEGWRISELSFQTAFAGQLEAATPAELAART